MNQRRTTITIMAICALSMVACNRGPKSEIEGFTKTESGLHYRFDSENKENKKVEKGAMLIGEMLLRLENDTLFSNIGDSGNLLIVGDKVFDGDVVEGLLMMHEGDKAVFAVDADKMAATMEPSQMPMSYKNGTGMRFYYEIDLQGVKSAEEMANAKKDFEENMSKMQAEESAAIEAYVKDNNITETPRDNGLYVIVTKKGNGPKVEVGKRIKVDYTGYLLNGKVFDSSIKSIAEENGLESHEALEFIVGQTNLIKGWDEGLMGLQQGSKAKLIIPSALAYGAKGAGDAIPSYAALVFDVEILSVN